MSCKILSLRRGSALLAKCSLSVPAVFLIDVVVAIDNIYYVFLRCVQMVMRGFKRILCFGLREAAVSKNLPRRGTCGAVSPGTEYKIIKLFYNDKL